MFYFLMFYFAKTTQYLQDNYSHGLCIAKKLSRKINGNNCEKKLAVLRLLGEDFMQGSNNDMYRYIRYKINGHYE